jgi:hypothetical protein
MGDVCTIDLFLDSPAYQSGETSVAPRRDADFDWTWLNNPIRISIGGGQTKAVEKMANSGVGRGEGEVGGYTK